MTPVVVSTSIRLPPAGPLFILTTFPSSGASNGVPVGALMSIPEYIFLLPEASFLVSPNWPTLGFVTFVRIAPFVP